MDSKYDRLSVMLTDQTTALETFVYFGVRLSGLKYSGGKKNCKSK